MTITATTSEMADLQEHQHLRPVGDRHRVGRAERCRIGEREPEVVDVLRRPVVARRIPATPSREHEGRSDTGPAGPFGGPTAVEQPVPQAEGDDVGQPDRAPVASRTVPVSSGLSLRMIAPTSSTTAATLSRSSRRRARTSGDAGVASDDRCGPGRRSSTRPAAAARPSGRGTSASTRAGWAARTASPPPPAPPAAIGQRRSPREWSYRRCRDRRAPSPAVRDQPPVEPAQNAMRRSTNRSGSTRWG